MMAKTYSATLLGVNAVEVEIECHEADGNQFRMTVVGLPDTAVKESRERVMAAVSTSGFHMPTSGYLTFNLSPADLRKEGSGFDLPMAISLVAGREKLQLSTLEECSIRFSRKHRSRSNILPRFYLKTPRRPWNFTAFYGP